MRNKYLCFLITLFVTTIVFTQNNPSTNPIQQLKEIPIPEKININQDQLDEWKNDKLYGIWLDGLRIKNNKLEDVNPDEIVYFMKSKLMKNAINYGKHIYQVNLYREDYFNKIWVKK